MRIFSFFPVPQIQDQKDNDKGTYSIGADVIRARPDADGKYYVESNDVNNNNNNDDDEDDNDDNINAVVKEQQQEMSAIIAEGQERKDMRPDLHDMLVIANETLSTPSGDNTPLYLGSLQEAHKRLTDAFEEQQEVTLSVREDLRERILEVDNRINIYTY